MLPGLARWVSSVNPNFTIFEFLGVIRPSDVMKEALHFGQYLSFAVVIVGSFLIDDLTKILLDVSGSFMRAFGSPYQIWESVWNIVTAVLPATMALLAYAFALWKVLKSPLRIVLYIPSVVYRAQLKLVSVVYFPLFWVVEPSKTSKDDVESTVRLISFDPACAIPAVMLPLSFLLLYMKAFFGKMKLENMDSNLGTAVNWANGYLYQFGAADLVLFAGSLTGLLYWWRARMLWIKQSVSEAEFHVLRSLGKVSRIFGIYGILYVICWSALAIPEVLESKAYDTSLIAKPIYQVAEAIMKWFVGN